MEQVQSRLNNCETTTPPLRYAYNNIWELCAYGDLAWKNRNAGTTPTLVDWSESKLAQDHQKYQTRLFCLDNKISYYFQRDIIVMNLGPL